MDALTGKLQWFIPLADWNVRDWVAGGHIALANDLVHVVKGSGDIFAIDLVTHEVRWVRHLEEDTSLE